MITIAVITLAVFLIVGVLALILPFLVFSRPAAVDIRLREMQKGKTADAQNASRDGEGLREGRENRRHSSPHVG